MLVHHPGEGRWLLMCHVKREEKVLLTFHEISAAQQSIPRTKSKIFSQDRLPLSSSSLAIIPYLSAAFFGTAVAWFPSSFFQHKISSFPYATAAAKE